MIHYVKRSNHELFQSFQEKSETDLYQLQNYQPMYNDFFVLKDTNYANICFNHKEYIVEILEKGINEHCYLVKLSSGREETIFIKYISIIDPLHYLVGKYESVDESIRRLPQYNEVHTIEKVDNKNNVAYIDSLFYFLATKLSDEYNFPHCVKYYDSFLGLKRNFKYDVYDEVHIIEESDYFNKEYNKKFKFDNVSSETILHKTENEYKSPVDLLENDGRFKRMNVNEEVDVVLDDMDIEDHLFKKHKDCHGTNNSLEEYQIHTEDDNKDDNKHDNDWNDLTDLSSMETKNGSDSESESESEYTDTDEEADNVHLDMEDHDENADTDTDDSYSTQHESEEEGDSDEDSDASEDCEIMNLFNIPVHLLCMEKLTNTLDDYIMDKEYIEDMEWLSILLQIIFTLITYQKVFDFTHNDLHTDNIMYSPTDKPYLYYKFENKTYKVPTYGKIFKIIDFGRAIYRYKSKRYCGDCYIQKGGDASTLYNCEPFLNPKKPIIEPNSSFDLTRLGCSLHEYFLNVPYDVYNNDIFNLVRSWTLDDNNDSILFTKNNVERYPGFLLYKMIARKVHCHVPKDVIKNMLFESFVVNDVCDENENENSRKLLNDIDKIKPLFVFVR